MMSVVMPSVVAPMDILPRMNAVKLFVSKLSCLSQKALYPILMSEESTRVERESVFLTLPTNNRLGLVRLG
jgi:hypothetical protein